MSEETKNTSEVQEEEILTSPDTESAAEEETAEQNTEETAENAQQSDADGESEEEAAQESSEDGQETKTKTSFFGKKKKEKDKLEQQIEDLTDRLKRNMAEFDNFRKRTEKEKASMYIIGAKEIVEKILPVVDNFERGLAGLSEEEMKQPFAEGMNMVYKQLITELEKLDVKPIEAVGCEFNPELHNAVMQVESDEYESGIIAQELQKGYTYRDSVVRHSMVAVVQ